MAERWMEGLDQVDSARLVDLLERLHREGVDVTPELAAEELSRLGDQRSREGLYSAALEHFSKEERRLRVQAEVTGGLLRKLRNAKVVEPNNACCVWLARLKRPYVVVFGWKMIADNG